MGTPELNGARRRLAAKDTRKTGGTPLAHRAKAATPQLFRRERCDQVLRRATIRTGSPPRSRRGSARRDQGRGADQRLRLDRWLRLLRPARAHRHHRWLRALAARLLRTSGPLSGHARERGPRRTLTGNGGVQALLTAGATGLEPAASGVTDQSSPVLTGRPADQSRFRRYRRAPRPPRRYAVDAARIARGT